MRKVKLIWVAPRPWKLDRSHRSLHWLSRLTRVVLQLMQNWKRRSWLPLLLWHWKGPLMIMSVFVLYKNINGADLGEIHVTRSACTEFLSNKSEVMKDEIAENLRGNNFLSAMADGGTDQGVNWSGYLATQEPNSGSSVDVLDAISFAISNSTWMEDSEWKEKLMSFGIDGCAVMTSEKWSLVSGSPRSKS